MPEVSHRDNNDQQQYEEEETGQDMGAHPGPPPFNPIVALAAAAAGAESVDASGLPSSIASDLMRVYESLTNNSTSQSHEEPAPANVATDGGEQDYNTIATYSSTPAAHFQPNDQPKEKDVHRPAEARNTLYKTNSRWTFDTTSIPVSQMPDIATTGSSDRPPSEQQQQRDVEEATSEASSTNRSLRKRSARAPPKDDKSSSGGENEREPKTRKKAKETDGRWSKRFTWPDHLHRDFVSAIFDVGLKHSSPSTILEQMPRHEQITSERIKSHLQKYRLHRVKSKKEFMSSYDSSIGSAERDGNSFPRSLSGGEVAAHLARATMNEGNEPEESNEKQPDPKAKRDEPTPVARVETERKKASADSQQVLMLPRLTEAEKQSPIGASMGYLMGLFFSLKQQLTAQRLAQAKKEQPMADVFNSFVNGQPPAAPTSDPWAPVDITSSNAAAAGATTAATATSSTRTNLEENTIMKREMENHMAFQNKMRALKQQEIKKCRSTSPSENEGERKAETDGAAVDAPSSADFQQDFNQGTGETAGDEGGRNRSISIGAADEFWNSDVVDDQLFEFLMNN